MRVLFLGCALLSLALSTRAFCEEPTFLFSTDQQIKNENLEDTLSVEKDIAVDKWFNSPPTRIELLTYLLDQYCKKRLETGGFASEIAKYFEKSTLPYSTYSADVSVTFSKKFDTFYVGVEIDGLGKPKKPMKDFCDYMIDYIRMWVSGEGYSYQNTILYPFTLDPRDPETLELVEKLKNNIVISISAKSAYQDEKKAGPTSYFIVGAYKSLKEQNVHYRKQSFKIDRKGSDKP